MDSLMLSSLRERLNAELRQLTEKAGLTGAELSGEREYPADPADRASMENDRSFHLLLNDRNRARLGEIREALGRFDTGEYGACPECGEDISPARLRAHPTALLCIQCQAAREDGPPGARARAV